MAGGRSRGGAGRRARGIVVLALTAALAAGACASKKEDEVSNGEGTDAGGTTTAPADTAATTAPEGAAADAAEFPDEPVGVTDDEIVIGIHSPQTLSGVDIESILGLKKLSEAFWRSTNEAGGINGRNVTMELVDDGYAVNSAISACRDLVAKKPLFISGTSGADQIVACGQLVLEAGIPYLSLGVSEAGLLDQPGYRALTMTYDQQSALLARYIVNELDGAAKELAMVRFNSPNSEGAHDRFKETLEELGASLAVDDAVDKQGNANELTSECLKLQQAGVEIVYIMASPTVSSGLANACESQGYAPLYISISNTFSCGATPPLFGPSLDGCLTFAATRPTEELSAPIIDEARETWETYYPGEEPPDSLEVFWAMFDVYRAALIEAGDDLTPRSFLQALDGLDYDNGVTAPIRSDGTRVLGHEVVVLRSDVANEVMTEVVSEWTSDF